jgi:hypothetical protein
LDLYADSDFTGNWDSEIAESDPSTVHSCTGYVLFYCRSPLLWASKMQTEIMLLSSKSEYIALSQAICATVLIMELLKEMKVLGFMVSNATPRVHCCAFEDNSGALETKNIIFSIHLSAAKMGNPVPLPSIKLAQMTRQQIF